MAVRTDGEHRFRGSWSESEITTTTETDSAEESQPEPLFVEEVIVVEKVLSFNPMVEVCFVPTRYEVSHLTRDLYWRPEDYHYFKQDAMGEIRAYWKATGLTPKEALVALYQPPQAAAEQADYPYPSPPPSPPSPPTPPSPTSWVKTITVTSMRQVDSLVSLQEKLKGGVGSEDSAGGAATAAVSVIMRHVDSLACMQHAEFAADTDTESTSSLDQSSGFGDLEVGEGGEAGLMI